MTLNINCNVKGCGVFMAENLNIPFENNIDFKPISFLGAKNVTFNETVKVSVPIQFVLSTCVFKIAEQHVLHFLPVIFR